MTVLSTSGPAERAELLSGSIWTCRVFIVMRSKKGASSLRLPAGGGEREKGRG